MRVVRDFARNEKILGATENMPLLWICQTNKSRRVGQSLKFLLLLPCPFGARFQAAKEGPER